MKKVQPGPLTLAADLQFFTRPEWTKVRAAYGLVFHEKREMDPGLMYEAVDEGRMNVICAYTSDRGSTPTAWCSSKTRGMPFPPYDAVLLVSGGAAERPGFVKALAPLVGAIDEKAMRRANYRVDVDHWTPQLAAQELVVKIERGPGG
jgi:osmoprotectant transport system permease protein